MNWIIKKIKNLAFVIKMEASYCYDWFADRFCQQFTIERREESGRLQYRIRSKVGRAFNSTIVRAGGRWILFYRYERWPGVLARFGPKYGRKTTLKAVFLTEDFTPEKGVQTLSLKAVRPSDPRAFEVGGKLYILYNEGFRNSKRTMWLAELQVSRTGKIESLRPILLKLDFAPYDCEKNWTPFVAGGRLFLEYEVYPHLILEVDIAGGECRRVCGSVLMERPEFRLSGGSPALRIGDKYVGALHTFDRLKHRYEMCFYSFDATPPFMLTGISDIVPFRCEWVVFPSGLAIHDGKVIISGGVDDEEAFLLVYPLDTLRSEHLFRQLKSVVPPDSLNFAELRKETVPQSLFCLRGDEMIKLTGSYKTEQGKRVRIGVESDRLTFIQEGRDIVPLAAVDARTFMSLKNEKGAALQFEERDGVVTGFVTYKGGKRFEFKKV